MATPEPSTKSAIGSLAVMASRRERLALISTRDTLCGIAAYTAALERQLADLFDVTVFDLDQQLLRSSHPRMRQLADDHVKSICRGIAEFDAVNLQLEHGTLGRSAKDICRRFSWLTEAAPRLSVTFHTVKRPTRFSLGDFFNALFARKFRTAEDIRAEFYRNRQLSLGIAKRLHRAQRRKPVRVIVHNRRDRSIFQHLYGLEQTVDHPLAFLSPAEVEIIKRQASRARFPLLDRLSDETKLIGAFGFLNDYKGFRTIVRALHRLPKNYELLIFGGIHPNEIVPHQQLHPYLASLLDDAVAPPPDDRTPPPGDAELDLEAYLTSLTGTRPRARNLSRRIHFMGAPGDADFLAGMAICDAVVFPYLEVGQSSSGPISQALELGCRIIASRTHTFLDFAAYHPNTIEFFDIGNYLELAERLAAPPQYAAGQAPPRYNTETNKAVYLAANSTPVETAPQWRRGAAASRQRRDAAAGG